MTRRWLPPLAVAALGALVALGCAAGDDRRTEPTPARGTHTTVAVPPPSLPSRPWREPYLDAIAERYRASCRAPGAAVGLGRNDGTITLGLAGELAPNVPIRSDSQFLAGSVTKLFVAAVALQLVAEGRLDLDESVARHLPGWPRGEAITVEMLLGHRSGMGDYGNDFADDLRTRVLADLDREYRYNEVLALVRAVDPVGPPGRAYHYSNANTIVLGAIVRRITGETLGRSFDRRIVAPLGLERTVYGPDDLDAAAAADLHGLFDVVGNGDPIDIGPFPRAAALTIDPAGAGLISTVPDLLAATRALFADNQILQAPQRRLLGREVSTIDAGDLLLEGDRSVDGHGGVSPGAQVLVAFDHRAGDAIVVWCNRLDPGANELLPSVVAAREVFLAAGTVRLTPG